MSTLAIKGHETRGKEVIELLEMLGGKTTGLDDSIVNSDYYYYIDKYADNGVYNSVLKEDFIVFTLEEFLEKYPYKIGDKVTYKPFLPQCDADVDATIISMAWDNYKNKVAYTTSIGHIVQARELQPYKEQENMNKKIVGTSTRIKENNDCPVMFIGNKDYDKIEFNHDNFDIITENGKTYLIKKPYYPKTYTECCEVLQQNSYFDIDGLRNKEYGLIEVFIRLKRCRDAYWEIAGEQMGLDKPWEPDWCDYNPIPNYKYIISKKGDEVLMDTSSMRNYILAFPTEEMRDAFYENFKSLIEQCKELL